MALLFTIFLLKNRVEAASADFRLIAVAYNLKRLLDILNKDVPR